MLSRVGNIAKQRVPALARALLALANDRRLVILGCLKDPRAHFTAETVRCITGMPATYRLGIVSGIIGQVMLVVPACTLFELRKDVYRRYARLTLASAVAGAVIERVRLDPIEVSNHERSEG